MATITTKYNVGDEVFVINTKTNRAEKIKISGIVIKQLDTKNNGLVEDVLYVTKTNIKNVDGKKQFVNYKERNVFATLDELTESLVKAVTASIEDETTEEE